MNIFKWFRSQPKVTNKGPTPKLLPPIVVKSDTSVKLKPSQITHPSLTPLGYWAKPDQGPRLLIITGAGLSAESGLSTFRDNEGLWKKYNIDEVCRINSWERNQKQVHEFYDALRGIANQSKPNGAHHALASLNGPDVVVVTQNVDGLLEKAGAENVLNLHGRLDRLQCMACDSQWNVPWLYQASALPQKCPFCSVPHKVKPGVVFFGEPAPLYRAFHNLIFGLRPQDAVVVIGTAGSVLPLRLLLANCQANKWLLNKDPSPDLPASMFDNVVYGNATVLVPELVEWWREYSKTA